MHHQDQTITHTPGNENHGVYVCHKCGWPFPNPHPSAKHRRAHKKICGTIEGYKEEPTNFNGSDVDYKTPGLVELGSNNGGIERKFSRSESEVYSDAVDDFPDTGLSQGVKHNLQQEHTLNSAADVSPLIASSSNDCQIKNPKIMQSESFEVGNIGGTQGQLSGSTVDPLTSSIADSKNEESSIVHGDGFSGLSSDSSLGIAEAVPNLLPEKNIYAGENVTDCSLVCDEKELNLKGTDEVKSEKDRVEIMESTDNIVGETYEGTPKIVVNEAISLDHDMGNEAVNPKEKKGPGSLSLLPQYEFPQEVNSSIITNEAQVESAHAIHSTSNEVEVLPEKEDVNVNIDPLPVHDDKFDAAYPQSVSLKHEEHVTEENNFHFNTSQLSERNGVLSSEMHVMDNDTKTENIHAEDCSEVSLVELTTETYQISHEIGVSTKTEMDENDFPEEHEPDEIHENSQPESSLMVSANEFQREASFRSATDETFSIISNDTTEINDASVVGKVVGENVVNDSEVIVKDFQPRSDHLQSEVEQSSDLFRNNSDDAGENGKIEDLINSNIKLYEENKKPTGIAADLHEEQDEQLSVKAAEDFSRKHTSHSSTNAVLSVEPDSAVEDDSIGEPVQDQSHDNLVKLGSSGIDTSADSHEAWDAQLLVKATEDLASKYASHSSINSGASAEHDSAVEDNSGGREVSRVTAVPLPVDDQSNNNLTKLTPPRTDVSVDSGSRRDSLEGNWGSGSVISMISDAPAVTDVETLPSTGSLASTEAGKSDLNVRQAAPAERQLSGKSETFELPSFTTLVEPSHVASPKGTTSETTNPQQSNSTSPAGWFPTLNQVINESEAKKKNEEKITKITNRSRSKEHTPLKSLLGEATPRNKPKSPKIEENNGSGLTTVNSILGPESPSETQVVKEKAANEWNSPARYPANIKREKKKLKSRPFWIQLVCCTTVDPQRR
ncbi:putative transcription factor C2H2 family [Medicago truncatula]|uniref:Putative transcription factor C2H2 family n=1 Tax=Medicago truncatula TaxID=3880 RepID=A0A072TTW9_MEDTR|nr:uncharacterized protein LOC25501782 isoform X1 [Medicago truncatula]KEH20641.1 salt-inducible protein, putative [Medicago truncatula]RHN42526.1 putative transcription factor C2H2 family [Medicago truncatula]